MKRHFFLGIIGAAMVSIALAQPPQPQGFGARAPQGANAGQAAAPTPNALFGIIDADGDGVITKRELRKAVAALKKLDLDSDGNITLEEVNAATTGAAGAAAGGPATFGGGTNFRGSSGFIPAGDPRSGPALSQYDRNGDGALTPDEVPPQLRGLVQGSDANNDGRLDPQEVALIQQRMNERARGQQSLPPGFRLGPQGPERIPQGQ